MLGIIFLSIITFFVAIGAYTYMKQSEYSKTAVPYIKEKIPELSTWDPVIAKKYLVPEVLAETNDDDLEKLMRWFSKLGRLKSIEEPQFVSVSSSVTTKNGQRTMVTYTINTHYENGTAVITMKLLEAEDSFQIYQFQLNSNAFIN